MGLSLSTALAFAVTVVLTLRLRPLALRLRITDKPGGRKQHIGEVPLVGGIAMFIGILVAALIMMIGGGLYLRDVGEPFGAGRLGLGIFAFPYPCWLR